MNIPTKVCITCNREQIVVEFPRRPLLWDGLGNECKSCRKLKRKPSEYETLCKRTDSVPFKTF